MDCKRPATLALSLGLTLALVTGRGTAQTPPSSGTPATPAALRSPAQTDTAMPQAAPMLPGMSAARPPAGQLWVRPLAEKRVDTLPAGALHWQVEPFATLGEAGAATGPWSLAVEADGRAWRFTLVGDGAPRPTSSDAIVVGPVERPRAARYLLRINYASGPRGDVTPVHSHPGSEAFYVLHGEHSVRTAHGTLRVRAGKAEPGHGADMAMQVSSSGVEDLGSLVMFVVDADRPFSSSATLD
ncbi:hypothetical protein [Lysobacter humi (ex Lee et al. 2017)]